MASKYGYMATIGADTSGLTAALKQLDSEGKSISAELKAVNNTLKFDDGGTVALTQKMNLLEQQTQKTKEKLEQLKSAENAINEAAARGDISAEQQRSYQRELESTENKLKRYSAELADTKAKLDGTEEATKDTTAATKQLDTAMGGAQKATSMFGDVLKANILSDAIVSGIRRLAGEVINFVKDSVNVASDLAEVQNVVDVTFGESSEAVNKWAKAAKDSYGISVLAAKQYLGTMGAMLKSSGITEEAVTDLSEGLVGLAGDMASFYNLDISTAFEKIRSGISGETEPLRQLGIDMSVTSMEAYALAQGIEKSWRTMSQSEKVQLRYAYLMQQSADAQGDFVRTQDSMANQARIAQLNMENLKAELGEKLLPTVNQLLGAVNSNMPQIADMITDIGNALEKTITFIVDNQDLVKDIAATAAITTAGGKVISTIDGIKGAVIELGQVLAANNAAKAAAEVTKAVGETAAAAGTATTSTMTFGTAAKTVFNSLASGAKGLGSAIAGAGVEFGALSVIILAIKAAWEGMEKASYAAQEKLEKITTEYYKQNDKVNELNSTLRDTSEQIHNIKEQEPLSLTEEGELTRLEQQYQLTKDTLELEKERLEIEKEQRQQATIDALYNSNGVSEGSIVNAQNKLNAYKNDVADAQEYLAGLQKNLDDAVKSGVESEIDYATEALETGKANVKATLTEGKLALIDATQSMQEAAGGLDVTTDSGRQAAEAVKGVSDAVRELLGLAAETPESYAGTNVTSMAEYYEAQGKAKIAALKGEQKAVTSDMADYYAAMGKADAENRKGIIERQKEFEAALEAELSKIEDSYATHQIVDADGNQDERAYYSLRLKYLEEHCDKSSKVWWTYRDEAVKAIESLDSSVEKETAKTTKQSKDNVLGPVKSVLDQVTEYGKSKSKEIAKLNEQTSKDWVSGVKSAADDIKSEYKSIAKEKETAAKELSGVDLMGSAKDSAGNDVDVLTDLNAERQKLIAYQADVEKLKATGISDDLLNTIYGMDYTDGSRQMFIDELLGLSPADLQTYYKDYADYMAEGQKAAQEQVQDDVNALNLQTAASVSDIYGNMPTVAYGEGYKTAQGYLQGITDGMGGLGLDLNAANALLGGNNTAPGNDGGRIEQAINGFKAAVLGMPINISLNDKQYIKSTLGDIINANRLSGGNNFNL